MRLSESLSKNVLKSRVDGILNSFKIKKRRDVFFFEDIIAMYVGVCEKKGYENEIYNIGKKWLNLSLGQTINPFFKSVPLFFLNKILSKMWFNLGLLDKMIVTKDGSINKNCGRGIDKGYGKEQFDDWFL